MDIKEKLKSELRNAGLNEGLADIIAVNDESHIKGAVESLQKLNKPSSLDDVLKDPIFQSEFDKRISKAIETSKKKNVVPPVPPVPPVPDPEKDEVTKLILGLQKSVSDLQGQVSGNQQASAAKDLIGKSKLPDTFKTSWLSRIDTNSEASISEQISGLESEYDVLAQSIADNTDIGGAPPSGSATSAAMSREELKKALGK